MSRPVSVDNIKKQRLQNKIMIKNCFNMLEKRYQVREYKQRYTFRKRIVYICERYTCMWTYDSVDLNILFSNDPFHERRCKHMEPSCVNRSKHLKLHL